MTVTPTTRLVPVRGLTRPAVPRLGPAAVGLLLIGVGVGLRLFHYWADHSLWFDELATILNLRQKSYRELLGPLEHAANGPPLFLWLEKWLAAQLGDHGWVWRLPGVAASLVGVVAFALFARRGLPADARWWAVGLFAVSDKLLYHTAEARPYTTDVLVAVAVPLAWLLTAGWPLPARIALFAAAFPVAGTASYTGGFVFCGVAAVAAGAVWRGGRRRDWVALAALLLVMAATLAWLATGPAAHQRQGMDAGGFGWDDHMPDWSSWRAAVWPLQGIGAVGWYALVPTGSLLLPVAGVGAWRLVRGGRGEVVVLLVTPLLAALGAGLLHKFVVGYRPTLFLTPAVISLVAAGLSPVLRWAFAAGPWRHPRRAAGLALVGLALAPAVVTAGRVVRPWPRPDCRGEAAYVLANRAADEPVVVNRWDQLYFYDALDPRWWCTQDDLATTKYRRVWCSVHTLFTEDRWDDGKPRAFGAVRWVATERREFGTLILLRLERIDVTPGGG